MSRQQLHEDCQINCINAIEIGTLIMDCGRNFFWRTHLHYVCINEMCLISPKKTDILRLFLRNKIQQNCLAEMTEKFAKLSGKKYRIIDTVIDTCSATCNSPLL